MIRSIQDFIRAKGNKAKGKAVASKPLIVTSKEINEFVAQAQQPMTSTQAKSAELIASSQKMVSDYWESQAKIDAITSKPKAEAKAEAKLPVADLIGQGLTKGPMSLQDKARLITQQRELVALQASVDTLTNGLGPEDKQYFIPTLTPPKAVKELPLIPMFYIVEQAYYIR